MDVSDEIYLYKAYQLAQLLNQNLDLGQLVNISVKMQSSQQHSTDRVLSWDISMKSDQNQNHK